MPDASGSGERKAVNVDANKLLQTVGGFLLTICLALTGWALKSVTELSSRTSVLEAQRAADDRSLQELKDGVKSSLLKIEHQLERLNDKIDKSKP